MEALEKAGRVHPRPAAVTAGLFCSEHPFFLAADKVQVKYEMLRAVAVDGKTIVAAAAAHGYSRAEFYLVQAAVAERGMAGLADERRGGQGPPHNPRGGAAGPPPRPPPRPRAPRRPRVQEPLG